MRSNHFGAFQFIEEMDEGLKDGKKSLSIGSPMALIFTVR